MFRRRFFYDLSTGAALRSCMAQGDLKRIYPAGQEAADVGLTNWGMFEWDEPDAAIEAAFADADADGNPRTVTASVVDGALHFEYAAIKAPDDPFEIIDILTGEESNG